ncbi:unnamed protein product, partial [Timema podura]|nr:unnamed protein product [Timema podura]
NTTQLPINFKTEVDPLSDGPCIPGNDLEREPQTFVCPMCCEKQFSLVDLQQHISSYIWGKLKCPVCDEICVGLEILAVHLDEHHIYQEMLVPEISLWTNEDKGSYTAEESVNVSCGDVTGQVIKDQTDVLTDDDKESITVDKSMNCDEKNTNVERQDMEICSQLKNDNDGSLSFTGMITKNIYDDDKSVKKKILSNTLKKSSNLGFDFENTPQQTTSQLQSTDSVSSDIETNDDYLSVIAGSSCAPDAHMSGVEQNSATSSENVSTSSTCEIENCDEALRDVPGFIALGYVGGFYDFDSVAASNPRPYE